MAELRGQAATVAERVLDRLMMHHTQNIGSLAREAIYRHPSAGDLTLMLIPGLDGASLSRESNDALWDKFCTAAPQRQRRSVDRYNIVKRAGGRLPSTMELIRRR